MYTTIPFYKKIAAIGKLYYIPHQEMSGLPSFSRIGIGVLLIPKVGPFLINLANQNRNIIIETTRNKSITFAINAEIRNRIHSVPLAEVNKINFQVEQKLNEFTKKTITYETSPAIFPSEFFNFITSTRDHQTDIRNFFSAVYKKAKIYLNDLGLEKNIHDTLNTGIVSIYTMTQEKMIKPAMRAYPFQEDEDDLEAESSSEEEENIKKEDKDSFSGKKRTTATRNTNNSNQSLPSEPSKSNEKIKSSSQPTKKLKFFDEGENNNTNNQNSHLGYSSSDSE